MDARYPERWLLDRRLVKLSHPAHRLFLVALVWSVSNRTDGRIEDSDLPLLPGAPAEYAAEVQKSGLWQRHGDHWQIAEFDMTQTSGDELGRLDRMRRYDRERKAKQRERKVAAVGAGDDVVHGMSQGRGHADKSRDRTGKARTGEDRRGDLEAEECSDEGGSTDSWPEVRRPGASDVPWQALAPGYDR